MLETRSNDYFFFVTGVDGRIQLRFPAVILSLESVKLFVTHFWVYAIYDFTSFHLAFYRLAMKMSYQRPCMVSTANENDLWLKRRIGVCRFSISDFYRPFNFAFESVAIYLSI